MRLDAWRALLDVADARASLKLDILGNVGAALTPDDVPRIVASVVREAWGDVETSGSLGRASRLPFVPDVANAVVGALLARDDVDRPLLQAIANAYVPDGPQGEELTAEILRRWYGSAPVQAVGKAVQALGTFPAAAAPGLLDDALFGAYPWEALRAMKAQRDPDDLVTLSRFAAQDVDEMGDLRGPGHFAISIIESRLDDWAIDVLLQLAGSAAPSVRERCMQGVESIQDYLLARQAWQRRMSEGRTRDDALAELLAMIDGDDALLRAESVRALGALGAVEHMPKVIALLRDADPSVAAAAREALDALHAAAAPQDD